MSHWAAIQPLVAPHGMKNNRCRMHTCSQTVLNLKKAVLKNDSIEGIETKCYYFNILYIISSQLSCYPLKWFYNKLAGYQPSLRFPIMHLFHVLPPLSLTSPSHPEYLQYHHCSGYLHSRESFQNLKLSYFEMLTPDPPVGWGGAWCLA